MLSMECNFSEITDSHDLMVGNLSMCDEMIICNKHMNLYANK